MSPNQRLRELLISGSLTHIQLLHHSETVTHNLRDLSARCSSFEWSWNKLISPHRLSTSALRFLHSNLLIVDLTAGTVTLAASRRLGPQTKSLALNTCTLQKNGKGEPQSVIFIKTILRMRLNTSGTADCLSVTGHSC